MNSPTPADPSTTSTTRQCMLGTAALCFLPACGLIVKLSLMRCSAIEKSTTPCETITLPISAITHVAIFVVVSVGAYAAGFCLKGKSPTTNDPNANPSPLVDRRAPTKDHAYQSI